MNFLQYKSDEMISSTQLIRKSKSVFDKLSTDEIEKAVILRDGKPSFLLMDFKKYEAIMEEYMALKEQQSKPSSKQKNIEQKKELPETIQDEEVQEALKKIDEIQLEIQDQEEEKQNLKEFWE